MTSELVVGDYFKHLKEKNKYNKYELNTIQNTVQNLIDISTSSKKPGMLLGNIQSGKTRSFIGAMGLAYDNGYDVVIIFTKNSSALVKQTYERIEQEYSEAIDQDQLAVYDIMKMPEKLRNYELKKKLVIVLKKEKKNMERLEKLLFEQYIVLASRKLLFIDDEADFASVAYENVKEKNIVELRVIAGQIDHIRAKLVNASYLQVTATPYSLYLQPEDMEIHKHKRYQPKRPAFTELVPIHNRYIGGEMYFELSKIEDHPASYIYHEIQEEELKILAKSDKRRVKADTLLTNPRIEGIRSALINFIVAGKIRNLQQCKLGDRLQKYAFIIHTMTSKSAHQWQEDVAVLMEDKLVEALKNDPATFKDLILQSYNDLKRSKLNDVAFPSFSEVLESVKESLLDQELLIEIVNSEKDVENLLDKSGQLKLRTPLNLFIGGQILDRGITIGNLIGFYYGRNPQKFQQDTVLQHSRMYGARPLADVALTRFYTTNRIYSVMERMHEFDKGLRQAFETGANGGEVTFIRKDLNHNIIPCNPNKILLSSIHTLKAGKRLLPIGFQTLPKTQLKPKMNKIDAYVKQLRENAVKVDTEDRRSFLVRKEVVVRLLQQIAETYVMQENYEWDLDQHVAILNYLTEENETRDRGKIWIVLRENRNIGRIRSSTNSFEDSPATTQDELKVARKLAKTVPALILTRQNGLLEQGWRGGAFYWPVIVTPETTQTTIFANKTID
ncbi:Z1 domain-containing protein [Alkalicoccobacillus gibsonii]|uniref:Z1 domain-containing protein n=1 Tax=Alkalicoccobacillus gibsonii TaxID=79881 RepID=UPI0035196E1A